MFTLQDIQEAARRVAPYIIETPVVRSQVLSERLGANVYLKLELFQRSGSFKPRGAFNQILQLDEAARRRGVVAVSGGNFAQAVAYAARVLDMEAIICMPGYTPANYLKATRAYGARVELGLDLPSLLAMAELYQEQGYSFLHPYDHPHQMAGNGTAGLEILDSVPQATDVLVSIGGGGLIAGMIVALKSLKPEVRVWGVETEGAQTMGRALEAGEVVEIKPDTLAKTLSAFTIAEDALTLAQAHLAGYVTVSDQEAVAGQQYLLEQVKVLTELAASCTLPALQKISEQFQADDHVVLLLCGGNESLENMIAYRAEARGRRGGGG
jgi:threonine dehydratase